MQINLLIIMVAIICATIAIQLYSERSYLKRVRRRLQKEYGHKPDDTGSPHDIKGISSYYNLIKKTIPEEELVDDITWHDLDMDKIFNRLNCTTSFIGEQYLYSELHRLPQNKEALSRREEAIDYYSQHTEKRVNTQTILMKLKKRAVNYYLPEFIDTLEVQTIPFFKVCRILQGTLLLFVIWALLSWNITAIALACANFLLNLAIYAASKTKYEILIQSLYGVIQTIKTADALIKSDNIATQSEKHSLDKLNKMSKLISFLGGKKSAGLTGDINGLFYDYLIGSLLLDFTVYDKVIHLLLKNKEAFLILYHFIGETDLSIVVGSFRQSLKDFCVPSFSEKSLAMTGIYHPLIDNAVPNDFELKQNIIITGSNASGKSTFIKAVAVNLILGQSIHTCTAKDMIIPDVKVLTSMAIRDDILSGESYYIKEIRYLKRMIESSQESRMVFCGIDEILRGTNTMERVAASIAILNYLNKKNCMLMVASHDLELAKTLEHSYENYYFCELIEKGDVIFDYKLRKGISNTNNAIRLLESMAFPDEIVRESRGRVLG